jgi:hypothetical protein
LFCLQTAPGLESVFKFNRILDRIALTKLVGPVLDTSACIVVLNVPARQSKRVRASRLRGFRGRLGAYFQ